ncbi:MAG: YCF48-related protein [Actinomycetota bacterium]|nr:YCF48-related protein [Actinomycetota bacterium]
MATTRNRPKSRPRPRRQPARRPNRERLLFVAAVVIVGLPVLLWAATRGSEGDESSPGGPGVSHVHGLGINPADGSLYVATHHGTFRIRDDDPAERVSDSAQDTMGFTVAGPDRFLGSGHPDVQGFRQGQPRLLGLIESTDAGKSWSAVSLSGEVDFHALAFAHGRTYGWDSSSGRFMVSSDQRTWDTRSTRPLISFAVDPTDPDHIVAGDPEGLIDSNDGGRTWQRLRGPALVALSWEKTAGLVGADTGGVVHRSTDGGASWSRAGRLPGSPQALLATADSLYAAADVGGTTGIYQSPDDGRTWSLRYRDSA